MNKKILFRTIIILTIIPFLASCASYAPPRSQRIYYQIAALELYPLIEEIFKEEGYEIGERDYARGYISTAWREYEGDKHGFVRWKERRKYVAFFDIDRMNSRHLLSLQLEVDERAPVSSDWRNKKVNTSSDSEYQRILKKLDTAVKKKGGMTA